MSALEYSPPSSSNFSNNVDYSGNLKKRPPSKYLSDMSFRNLTQTVASPLRVIPAVTAGTALASLADMVLEPARQSMLQTLKDNPYLLKKDSDLYKQFTNGSLPLPDNSNIHPIPDDSSTLYAEPDYVPPSGNTLISVLEESIKQTQRVANAMSIMANNSKYSVQIAENIASISKVLIDKMQIDSEIASQNLSFMADFAKSNQNTVDYNSNQTEYSNAQLTQNAQIIELLDNINTSIANNKLEHLYITENKPEVETELMQSQLDESKFRQTPIQLDNIETIPEATPNELKAIKDAVTALKNSDENTFDVDSDEFEDMFTLPDIAEIFNYMKKSQRVIEGVNS